MNQQTMKAAAIDKFGGPEEVHTATLPVPRLSDDEVLIEVEAAGVGVWDPYVISGKLSESEPKVEFPRVFGSDGAGKVAAVGKSVTWLKPGDRVYGWGFENAKGGFFAQYIALSEKKVSKIPEGLTTEEAAGLAIDGITGLEGLDELKVKNGDTILVIGASGGAGHLVCQLAKRRALKVFAVASGPDGVELCQRLGCDAVTDGKSANVVAEAKKFSPGGYDGAVVFAGNDDGWASLLALLKPGTKVAYPNGVEPKPKAPAKVKAKAYDGESSPEIFAELNELIIDDGPRFHVNVARTYPLDQASVALREVDKHFVGKLVLQVR